ncbi:putative hydro-lyase [Kiritimatiellaeota bacterium B1221]|nr:putative hydro-lyase [Kiritimatiellaeota bacterium B1221]
MSLSCQPLSPHAHRMRIRRGEFTGHTSGLAPGYVQANLVILPQAYATDFTEFCKANPRPCPLISISARPGQTNQENVAHDLDIRKDLPKYRIFQKGKLQSEPAEISDYWRDDFRTFLIGCSFSFEEALLRAGLEIRNITEHKNVPMYVTGQPCTPAGIFSAPLVVSMRPMNVGDAEKAAAICKRYPHVHGEPLHIGNPRELGIRDLNTPDFGEAVSLHPGEVPVFWACGVTPQLAVMNAAPEICITHSPGHMLITDLENTEQDSFTPPLLP